MKKILLLAVAVGAFLCSNAQTQAFTEKFELPGGADSVSSVGTPAWTINTTYASEGVQSMLGTIGTASTTYLESNTFSTIGNTFIRLEFDHICKIEFFDSGTIEVSNDGGATWTQLTCTEYLGTGTFCGSGNKFASNTYLVWDPANPSVQPNNAWWQTETFDMSTFLSNTATAKVRFKLTDGNNNGSGGNYGWLVDNIRVVVAPCELIPPVITLNSPVFQDTAYITGPFNIGATITDASGIDSAVVVYNVNGGPNDTVAMTAGAGGIYNGVIPAQLLLDQVCYQVVAWDSSACGNITKNPNPGFNCFYISDAPPPNCVGAPISTFPWTDDFEAFVPGTANFGAGVWGSICCNWERFPLASASSGYGWCVRAQSTPSFGTGPDFDNTSGNGNFMYTEVPFGSSGDTATLTSPCLDLDGMVAPQMEFYYHMTGTGCGTLEVLVNNGVTWTNVFTIQGQQQSTTTSPWIKVNVPLFLYAGNIIQIKFRTTATSSTGGDIAIDDVTVFEPQPIDGAIIGITAPPVESCGFSTNEDVIVQVFNAGTTAQDTLPVAYTINGSGVIIRDTIYQNLLPGDTLLHTFSQGADLSQGGVTYNILPWTEFIGEQGVGNDTLNGYNVLNSLTPPAYIQDFENFTSGSQNAIEGWVQSTTDDDDWTFLSGSTTSGGTGPQFDHTTGTLSGVYAYMEVSQVANGETIELISPCLDFSLSPTPKVEFWYHMLGTQIGTLNLDVQDTSGNWINEWTLSGNQGNQWTSALVDLTPYAFQNVKIRFRAQSLGCCAGDIAIDDIFIFQPQPNDVGVAGILSPLDFGCDLGPAVPVTVQVSNYGTSTQDTIPVSYQLDNGTVVTDTLFAVLNPGDTLPFTFGNTVDLSTPGTTYNLDTWTDLASEQTFLNDSILGYTVINTLLAPPFIQDFENFSQGQVPSDNWEQDNLDDDDWTFQSGPTTSTNTGPTVDHTLGTAAGMYAYMEVSFVGNGETVNLISPCIDLTNLIAPKLKFWYHMWGTSIGTLSVDVLDTNGVYNQVWTLSGDQGNVWREGFVDLAAYAGTITKIRFRAFSLGCCAGDIAIDDINVYEPQPNDVSMSAIVSPSSTGCDLSATEAVIVEIVNLGLNTQTSIPVQVTVAGQPPVTGTWTGTLNPGDTVLYTLPGTVDMSTPATTYNVSGSTNLSGDQVPSNDTISGIVVENSLQILPYVEPFTTFTQGGGTPALPGTLDNFWTRSSTGGDGGYNWLVQSGPTGSFGTGPNGDNTTGTGNYMYVESSFGATGEVATLTSPCLDLNWYSARVDFYTHMFGAQTGIMFLDIQDTTGVWTNLWTLAGQQQTSEQDPYQLNSIDLSAYVGQFVKLRFRAQKTGFTSGDMALDDINVYPVYPSAGVNEITVSPSNFFILPQASPVSAEIENTGLLDLDHFKVTLEIDNNTIVTDSLFFPVPLGPGQTTTHTFSQIWQADPGAHTICVYTAEPNLQIDGFPGDDTLCYVATVFDSTSVFPYCNNFDGGQEPLVALNYITYEPQGNVWEAGTPNQTVINGAFSAPNAWMTGLNADYEPRDSSALFSPLFNINPDSCYKISFYHSYKTESFQDGGAVEYSLDGGTTWTSIGSVGADWYNTQFTIGLSNTTPGNPGWTGTSNGWEYAERTVQFASGGPVIFRWRFGADFSIQDEGWAIDDICIENIGACNPTSVEEEPLLAVSIYPNPASDQIRITLPDLTEPVTAQVVDAYGSLITEFATEPNGSMSDVQLDVRQWAAGVYFIKISQGRYHQSEKFVISR